MLKDGERRDEKGWLTRLKEDGDGVMKGEKSRRKVLWKMNRITEVADRAVANGVKTRVNVT